MSLISLRLNSSLQASIYDKSLKLSSSSRKDISGILSYMTNYTENDFFYNLCLYNTLNLRMDKIINRNFLKFLTV